jgi:acylphosphatase
MAGEASGERVRHHVTYSGRVQGVCFRMITSELSSGRDVVGYVRNRPDGTVELEAEGHPEQVDEFLQAVERHFSGNISGVKRSTVAPLNSESRFEIRY